jgi:hypothetical protein
LVAVAASANNDWFDCTNTDSFRHGVFDPVTKIESEYDGSTMWGYYPKRISGGETFPLMAFMHGSTGQFEFYDENLAMYASHGFVILFPFIKNPEKDKNPLTTNTNGKYLLNAVEYAKIENENPDSPLYGMIDMQNIVLAGHSMGATDSIEASHRYDGDGKVVLTVTQHPGLCGPLGPPPSPDTWMPKDMSDILTKHPLLMTTARNDGAFLPAPLTANHEYSCYQSAIEKDKSKHMAAFVEFSEEACAEDGDRQPIAKDGGHMCPCKFKNGGGPETPWVLTAAKLYAQKGGSDTSECYRMLWGDSYDSLQNSETVERYDLFKPDVESYQVMQ